MQATTPWVSCTTLMHALGMLLRLLSTVSGSGDAHAPPLTTLTPLDAHVALAPVGVGVGAAGDGGRAAWTNGVAEPGLGALVKALYAVDGCVHAASGAKGALAFHTMHPTGSAAQERAGHAEAVVRVLHAGGGAETLSAITRALDFILEARVPDEVALTIALYAVRAALPWRQARPAKNDRVRISGQRIRDSGEGSRGGEPIDEGLARKLMRLIAREEASPGVCMDRRPMTRGVH